MSKRKYFNTVLGLFSVLALASCSSNDKDDNTISSNPQQLQILNTGTKLTQDQMLSQIKAEYLIENNGYKDDDLVTVILSLEDDSLITKYNSLLNNKYKSVSEYVSSAEGISYQQKLTIKQNELIKKLKTDNLIDNVLYKYTTVTNGIAVEMLYKNLSKVEGVSSIKYAALSETYNQVKTTTNSTTSYSVVENLVDVYESTGIFNSSSVPYTGEGTAVAILDSGFDVSHEVFSHQPETEMINMDSLEVVINSLNAAQAYSGLEATDVYYSKKIPYMFDYADDDPDVAPFDSSHGTHVAGIIGGSSDTITGVAVNTQLVLMKVFGDKDNGAESEDILAGLEDAVILGVDCINMSLGTTCGFSREVDEEHINEVYDAIEAAGITCLAAASNDYSSGMNGPTGNTSLVTHPDSGTVGSPGSYDSTLTVASISGVKSKYVIGNDSQVFFFKESNQIDGTTNDFMAELYEALTKSGDINKIDSDGNITLEYVTVPGIGANINYANCNVSGKIALVRRGSNTFEEKASIAKAYGAIACIIYNNVDGDISMSMGKTDHIPCVSISKDDGTILASRDTGTMTFNFNNQAGPFMSDFSSWGPTPDLKLKPEITGHGGSILSAIPGGGYEEMSGTSMATPNLCGVTVLIRQYLKEKYAAELANGTMNAKDINRMSNQLLMSTATIAEDENGNSYSPRKQGAGLASLKKATTTNAFISVDGIDKSKLELGDDKNRSGIYTMTFNVENMSSHSIDYRISVNGITESVSSSDYTHLAEKAQNLNGTMDIKSVVGGSLNDDVLTLPANGKATITLTYTLSDADKEMMDSSFPYGIYVEGFVKLTAIDSESEVDLNVPFLAFYGDWTQAPILDKTFFEVESEAHNDAIDDEDKIAADYYATTPYASYLYSYIISLGTYIYDMPAGYDPIPASLEHIAISDQSGTLDGISAVYAGLLRSCKEIDFTIVDNVTGEVVYELVDYNGRKAATSSGSKTPYINYFKLKASDLNLVNNRKYTFNMLCKLDYGDGGVSSNVRNTFSYDFTFDNEAPIIENATYEVVYDKSLKKNRYYMTLDIYDNHYVQCITPLTFTSNSTYSILSPNPIPVYGEKATTSKVRFEITDYLADMTYDQIIKSAIPIQVTDYALNTNIFLCQFPGTKGDFKFTADGTADGKDNSIQRVYVGDYLDLTQFLYSSDSESNDPIYFSLLNWSSSNENVCIVKEGIVEGLSKGQATITVSEGLNGKFTTIRIDVRENTVGLSIEDDDINIDDVSYYADSSGSVEDATIESLRFSYFNTLYAHAECSERSIIGRTGDVVYVNSLMDGLEFYPGEKIKLNFDFDPWYAKDNYEFTWTSTNPLVASVDQNGVVYGLKKGSTIITLGVNGSNIKARINVTIKSEFVIEEKTLVAYKGLGGDVVIPDDEGLLYIGAYAFSLYTVDKEMYVDEEDYDANKIPSENNTITSVTIPKGVENIQKYAFYNCKALEKVVFLDKIKNIYEYAFANCYSLTDINLDKVSVIGKYTFANCTSLKTVDLSNIYAIGMGCFQNATALEYADLSSLRNNSEYSFENTTSLKTVVTNKDTKLSVGMFINSGLTSIVLDVDRIPASCFKNCKSLESVEFTNSLVYVGESAFSGCSNLTNLTFNESVRTINDYAFNGCNLNTLNLPNCSLILGNNVFSNNSNLTNVVFAANTYLSSIGTNVFNNTAIVSFNVTNNSNYEFENNLLLDEDKTKVVFATSNISSEYVIPSTIEEIGASAFSACNNLEIVKVESDLTIGNGAFAGLSNLKTLSILNNANVVIKANAFLDSSVNELLAMESVKSIGANAFKNTSLTSVTFGDDVTIDSNAFESTSLVQVTLGNNTTINDYAFANNTSLVSVIMPSSASVEINNYAFYNDSYLQTIDLSKATVIGPNSFNNCVRLLNADIKVEEIGYFAFANCRSLVNVTLENTKIIGACAFALTNLDDVSKAPAIKSLVLPETLESIGDFAFYSCTSLEAIVVPQNVTYIGRNAFASCTSLTSVELPADLETIKDYTFYGCEKLQTINLANIITIGSAAFANCTSLQTVDLTYTETVMDYAFQNASLINLTNTSNIEYIGSYAFSSNLFTSFDSSSVITIKEGAFMNAKNLTSFTFYKDLVSVSPLAFYGATNLESFYALEDNNKTGVINDYAFVEDGILYTYLQTGKLVLSAVPAKLNITTLNVKSNTYRVEAYAGNANRSITTIVLPDGLKTIGDSAFYGYTSLKKVVFNTAIAPCLENNYDSNSILDTNDPGYSVLYNIYSLFDVVYSYKNFINLAGSNNPISMELPNNEEVIGYDSLVYKLFFGDYKNAIRTSYTAMDQNTVEFLDAISLVPNINDLVFRDQDVVINALTCYNKLKQDLTNYGYTEIEVLDMVTNLMSCKAKIQELKLLYASTNVQKIQEKINSLGTTFTIDKLKDLYDLNVQINNLSRDDKEILDLTGYNELKASYDDYRNQIKVEANQAEQTVNNIFKVAVITALSVATVALAIFVSTKKYR